MLVQARFLTQEISYHYVPKYSDGYYIEFHTKRRIPHLFFLNPPAQAPPLPRIRYMPCVNLTRSSRCNTSWRCAYRAREHVDPTYPERSGAAEIATRSTTTPGITAPEFLKHFPGIIQVEFLMTEVISHDVPVVYIPVATVV